MCIFVLPDTFNKNSVVYLQVPINTWVPPMTNSLMSLKKYSIFSCRTEYLKMPFLPTTNLILTSKVLALKVCFVPLHSVH